MTDLNLHLHDDQETVTLTISTPANSPVAVYLKASDLDQLLVKLGQIRATMQPSVAPSYALGQKQIDAIIDPPWGIEAEVMRGDSVLHVRSPAFGWLHFLFPRAQAAKLSDFMRRQAYAPDDHGPTSSLN